MTSPLVAPLSPFIVSYTQLSVLLNNISTLSYMQNSNIALCITNQLVL